MVTVGQEKSGMTLATQGAVGAHCIMEDSRPWIPLRPYAELVLTRLYAVDPLRGEMVCAFRAPPGLELPRHRTTGSAIIHTMQGRWKYREHDWICGPGSVVVETAAATLTPQSLADGTDDVILFVVATGEMLILDGSGQIIGSENWRTATDRYLDFCQANDQSVPSDAASCCTSAFTFADVRPE
jgi:2,4'-dihydroxyacetophenone dioxygenase